MQYYIVVESVERFINPVAINFREAIIVAVIGLIVNIICAMVLLYDKEHNDHNIKGAYLHVLSDALTSFTAIIALIAAMFWNINSIDVIAGILGSVVITKWAFGLLKITALELLDYTNDIKKGNHVK